MLMFVSHGYRQGNSRLAIEFKYCPFFIPTLKITNTNIILQIILKHLFVMISRYVCQTEIRHYPFLFLTTTKLRGGV